VRTGHNRVRDALNKIARSIIYYCLTHQLGKLIIGCNPAWKQGINLSKQNKFQFVLIHHYVLQFKLKALCQRYGTAYREKEEGCTSSSASLFDPDELPIYKADNPQGYKFRGRHLCRGLYKSKNYSFIDADCNGATNILKKSNHNLDFPGVARGLFLSERGTIAHRTHYELIS
jgi:IS605 OrfB family transposase